MRNVANISVTCSTGQYQVYQDYDYHYTHHYDHHEATITIIAFHHFLAEGCLTLSPRGFGLLLGLGLGV